MKDKVLEQLKTQFRPEFLNRVDSFVVFRSLHGRGDPRDRRPAARAACASSSRRSRSTWRSRQEAKDHIIKLGYDVDYGARPLRRVIQNMVEDPLAEALLLGSLPGRPDRRRRRSADAGPDHRAARREDAGRGAPSAGGAAREPLRLPVLRPRPACAGRAAATPAAPGTPWSRPSGRDAPPRAEPRRAPRRSPRRPRRPCAALACDATSNALAGRASARSTASSAAASCPARWCCSAASRASASRRSCWRSPPARGASRGRPPGRASCTRRARSRPAQLHLRADRLGLRSGAAGEPHRRARRRPTSTRSSPPPRPTRPHC